MATETEQMRAAIEERLARDKRRREAAKQAAAEKKRRQKDAAFVSPSGAPEGTDTYMMEKYGGSGGPEPAPKFPSEAADDEPAPPAPPPKPRVRPHR